jgi:putative CocE/NonD family hydrolase
VSGIGVPGSYWRDFASASARQEVCTPGRKVGHLVRKVVFLACLFVGCGLPAAAQQFDFPEAAVSAPAAAAKAMPVLATQILESYKEPDQAKYLENVFGLQLVAGKYVEAQKSISELRAISNATQPSRPPWLNRQYEIYAAAKYAVATTGVAFPDAYSQAFREAFSKLDNLSSSHVVRALAVLDPSDFQQDLQRDLDKQKGKSSIELADALKLVSDYQVSEAFREPAPLFAALIAEDDARRYVTEKGIAVKTPDGATLCALTMRPRATSSRLPTLLKFTIYVEPNYDLADARLSAAHGYAAVVGYVRGKVCSPDKRVAYEHDGSDAAALIDWIAAQPWSDGRVGMYSGSYNGFTQFAAAKYMPKALKAIMAGAAAAPGIDVPMEGNVFWNFIYPWPFYTLNGKTNDEATYNDYKRWQRIDHEFYASGRAYRDLDKIDGTPNPTFDQWISHPSYDAFWQSMIPYGKEFARVNIPVLQTAGYYYGGPGAAVYYFSEHQKANPKAEHYLLIGPYHHFGAQFGVFSLLGKLFGTIGGMELDPVARIDIEDLRFEWFDYLFKGASRPALLQDKVNYQVTGANVWKHAPTLAAMGNQKLRFHLSAAQSGKAYQLSSEIPDKEASINLKVDLADRSDVDREAPGGGILDDAVDTANALEFISDPLPQVTEVSGLFSASLDFSCNKKDFDFQIELYEQTPKGKFAFLTSSWARASYVENRSQRHLLTPGKRALIKFQSNRLMSRQFEQGSRLVMLLRVIKESGRQINYGTGKDVSDESIADAKPLLEITWFTESFIDIPVWR